jgi:cytochrome c nitrite reductase small subunit
MSEEAPRNGRTGLRLIVVGATLGVVLAAGAGFGMKVTDRRPFCASCHIMQEAALTHKASTHAKLACNECHAPQNLAAKLPFKAAAGAKDVYMNTLGRPDDVIHSGQSTKDVVNANCKACHTMTNTQVASMDSKPYCVDCHRNVQHMRMTPISTRKVADG